jgi:hypothetical protein
MKTVLHPMENFPQGKQVKIFTLVKAIAMEGVAYEKFFMR